MRQAVLGGDTEQCSRVSLPKWQRRHVLVTHMVPVCGCWKSPSLQLHPISGYS